MTDVDAYKTLRPLAATLALAAGVVLLVSGFGQWGCPPPRSLLMPVAAAGLLLAAWQRLVRPLERLREPEDVGYVPARGRSRARTANEVRRRRRVGELPPAVPNGWYRVLDSQQLRRAQVRDVSMFGVQLAVFRGEDGQVHVLDAYCPHLGANLAVGGRVLGGCLECPFHGWMFQGSDGKCVKIPYTERVPDSAKVRRWHSCEVNSLILVWFHCDGDAPHWHIPEQQEIFSGCWVYRGRTEHFVSCHIQEIPENGADIAHLAHVHRPCIVSGVDLRYTYSRLWEFVRHDWTVQWEPEKEPNKHCSRMELTHALYVFGHHCSLLDVHVVARQMGPGLVFLHFQHRFLGRGVILQSVTPVEPLLQRVHHTIFWKASVPALVPKFLLYAESIQFERDVMVWNNKTYTSKPLLLKEDAAIGRHRRWFRQFYSDNSPRMGGQRDTMDF